MIARGARSYIAAGVLTSIAWMVACSSSEDVRVQTDGADGSVAPPADTGTTADGGHDRGAEVESDSGPRVCSSENFCQTLLPDKQLLRGVWGDGQGVVWAVSDSGSILRGVDEEVPSGSEWVVHVTNSNDHYAAIWGSSPTDIWVAGSSGLLHGTGASPAELVFAPVAIPEEATTGVSALWGTGPDDIWAVGGTALPTFPATAQGFLLHYASGSWTLDTAAPTNVAYTHVWGTPSSGLWVGGSPGTGIGLYRRAAGASDFVAITLPNTTVSKVTATPFRFDGANATSDTTVIVLGAARSSSPRVTAPTVWRGTTQDNGATFSWSSDPYTLPDYVSVPDFALTAVWGTGSNDTWVAGAYGRLQHWDGATWVQAALTLELVPDITNLRGLWGRDSNDFWVVGDNLAIHKVPAVSP